MPRDLTVGSFHCWSSMSVVAHRAVPQQCERVASRLIEGVPYCGQHARSVWNAKRAGETGSPRIQNHHQLTMLAREAEVTRTLAGRG